MASMSRKNYVAIAKILVANRYNGDDVYQISASQIQTDAIARDLASYFEQDNEHFDRRRFYEAAEVFEYAP